MAKTKSEQALSMESKWYEEGKKLRTEYKRKYKKDA